MLWVLLLLAQEFPAPAHVIELRAELGHVQGIEVEGKRLWVTDVDTKARRGRLHLFSLPDGKLLRTVDVTRGEQYHPGGIAADASSIWLPVAEYRRNSSATIERRDKRTLKLIASFEVKDHIGCLAVGYSGLWAANWDSRLFYVFDLDGKLRETRRSPTEVALQDIKFRGSELIGGGLLDKQAFVVRISTQTWAATKKPLGKTDRGVPLTQEGLAIRGEELYLLPEDGRSRLFVFRLGVIN